jgi:hypothetical protein
MRFRTLWSLLAAALLVSPAAAQTLAEAWVAPAPTGSDANDGSQLNPFATIQHAIDQTLDSGTVHVLAGTHNPSATISISRPVTLLGDGSLPLVEFPAGSSYVSVTTSDVTIEGIHFKKTDTSTDVGMINVQRGGSFGSYFLHQNITIDGCIIEGARRGGYIAAENLLVEDCTFTGQARDCLFLSSSQGTTTIRGNNFSGAAGNKAIVFENFSSADPETSGDILIEFNTVNGKGNFIVFNQWLGDNTPDLSFLVRNNSIDNTSSKLITFYAAYVQDPNAFQRFTSIDIIDNIMSNRPTRAGVFVEYDDAGSALNAELKPVPAAGQINVSNNVWFNLLSLYAVDTVTAPSGASNAVFSGSDNVEADPLYTDAAHANNNFAIAMNSPARGAGAGLTNIGADQSNAPKFGDANNDGSVDNVDAVAILEIFLGITPQQVPDAQIDINQDGNIDNVDAVILFSYVVGNIPEIPYP